MTKRSDEGMGGLGGGGGGGERIVQSGRNPRRERKVFAGNARSDPWTKIRRRVGSTTKGEGRRKEQGKNEGQKGFPKAPYGGSVNATLKSAYKSLRRRFPSARGVPIGLKLVRLTDFVPSRFFARYAVFHSLSRARLDRSREERFFCNRCAFSRLRIDPIVANIVSLSRHCNDPQDPFAGLRRDVRR